MREKKIGHQAKGGPVLRKYDVSILDDYKQAQGKDVWKRRDNHSQEENRRNILWPPQA